VSQHVSLSHCVRVVVGERHCQVQVPRVNASACVEAVRCSAGSKARAAQVDDAVPRTSRLPGATHDLGEASCVPLQLTVVHLSLRGVVQMESDHIAAHTLPTHSLVGSGARAVVQARCKNESTAYPSTDIETAVRLVLLQQPCALRAQHGETTSKLEGSKITDRPGPFLEEKFQTRKLCLTTKKLGVWEEGPWPGATAWPPAPAMPRHITAMLGLRSRRVALIHISSHASTCTF
jgi:hypothetical protein